MRKENREEREETKNERKYVRETDEEEDRRKKTKVEMDHVGGGSAQRLRKTHKQAYYNNGRACCTNTISA